MATATADDAAAEGRGQQEAVLTWCWFLIRNPDRPRAPRPPRARLAVPSVLRIPCAGGTRPARRRWGSSGTFRIAFGVEFCGNRGSAWKREARGVRS